MKILENSLNFKNMLGDRKTELHQARQTKDRVRPLLEKQDHPEYDHIGVWILYVARLAHSSEYRLHQRFICVSASTGEM